MKKLTLLLSIVALVLVYLALQRPIENTVIVYVPVTVESVIAQNEHITTACTCEAAKVEALTIDLPTHTATAYVPKVTVTATRRPAIRTPRTDDNPTASPTVIVTGTPSPTATAPTCTSGCIEVTKVRSETLTNLPTANPSLTPKPEVTASATPVYCPPDEQPTKVIITE